MRKILTFLIVAFMLFSMVSCDLGGGKDSEDFGEAQEGFENIEDSDNKETIEKNIKDVFGVKITLPEAEDYAGATIGGSSMSMYMVTMTEPKVNAEEFFADIASAFSSWEANEDTLTYSRTTDKVLYGAVIAMEGDLLTIAFSMTDNELIEGMTSGPTEFIKEIEKYSGVKLEFPSFVTSVGLPSLSNDGAKAQYGGMLLNGSANLNEENFLALADALSSQLSGYTMVEGEAESWGPEAVLQWIDNSDESRYFELELYDFDGMQYVEFAYHYTDRSLLPAWPSDQIDAFFGKAIALPAYSGNYKELEVSEYKNEQPGEYSEYLDHIAVYMTWTEEEELDPWLASIESAGYAKTAGDYTDEYIYVKDLGNGLYANVSAEYDSYGGQLTITVEKEELTGLEWPAEHIKTQYGAEFAALLPAIAEAPRRVFDVENNYIYIRNNLDTEAVETWCAAMRAAGFEETTKTSERAKYSMIFDNYDQVEVSLSFGENYGTFYVDYEKYEGPGFTLPTNAYIEYTYAYSSNPDSKITYKVTKIGEDYYFDSGALSKTYFKYDASAKTWTRYNGMNLGDSIMWIKADKVLDRYGVDKALKSSMNNLFYTKSNYMVEDQSTTKTIAGSQCIKITSTQSTAEYWLSRDTGLLFAQNAFTLIEVVKYDTSVKSLADAGITADMLPNE